MGLADQINQQAADKMARQRAYDDEQHAKKVATIVAKLDYDDGPPVEFIEVLDEKEWRSGGPLSNGYWDHKRWYVLSVDDVIVHATVGASHASDVSFYVPQTCVGCRKDERVTIPYFYAADYATTKPADFGIGQFIDAYARALSTFRTRQHSRCWECRKEMP